MRYTLTLGLLLFLMDSSWCQYIMPSGMTTRGEIQHVVDKVVMRPIGPVTNVYMQETIKPLTKMAIQGVIDKNKEKALLNPKKKKKGLFRRNK